MALSLKEILKYVGPHKIGDKVYYISPLGKVSQATIIDIEVHKTMFGEKFYIILKVRAVAVTLPIEIGKNIPRKIWGTRHLAIYHSLEVIKYFEKLNRTLGRELI